MKLKKFILFTVILSSLFVAIGLYIGTPIAFIPENASSFEYIVTKVLFATTIAVFILSVFIHFKNNIKRDKEYKKR